LVSKVIVLGKRFVFTSAGATSFGECAFAVVGMHLISSDFEFFKVFVFVDASVGFTGTVSIIKANNTIKTLIELALRRMLICLCPNMGLS
jgi:hypothetical protein